MSRTALDELDPVERRRRRQATARREKVLLGAAVGGIFLLAAGLLVAGLVAARQRGDLPAGVPVVEQLAGSADGRRLAEHPWWKGRVTPEAVDALIGEILARGSGRGPGSWTVFYNQKGEFRAVNAT